MIKLEVNEFIDEVREELRCYDEIGDKGADNWVEGFKTWLKSSKSKNIVKSADKVYYQISDESEIFDIADEYLAAVEENSVEKYWKTFK